MKHKRDCSVSSRLLWVFLREEEDARSRRSSKTRFLSVIKTIFCLLLLFFVSLFLCHKDLGFTSISGRRQTHGHKHTSSCSSFFFRSFLPSNPFPLLPLYTDYRLSSSASGSMTGKKTRIRCSLVSYDACLKSLPSSYCSSFNQGFDKQNVIPLFQWWYYSSAHKWYTM